MKAMTLELDWVRTEKEDIFIQIALKHKAVSSFFFFFFDYVIYFFFIKEIQGTIEPGRQWTQ